jgi:hypothetical protein
VPTPIDHVLVVGPGPYYAPLAEFDVEEAYRYVDAHLLLPDPRRSPSARAQEGQWLPQQREPFFFSAAFLVAPWFARS